MQFTAAATTLGGLNGLVVLGRAYGVAKIGSLARMDQ